jgi:hypothetical protein
MKTGNPRKGHAVELFNDNWVYLKVELNWLERLLVATLSRHRQDKREVERLAKSRADQAASHWWKGLVSLEGGGYDSPKPVSASGNNYQQQLEARIRASQAQGIRLALPLLVDRWQLSLFEKQTLLLALAPEVHRRYGDMYAVLTEQGMLPTLDLALRLFCRDDRTWQMGRAQLLQGKLVQCGLLQLLDDRQTHQSGLQRSLRLREDLTTFLLSEQANLDFLDHLDQLDHRVIPLCDPEIADLITITDRANALPAEVISGDAISGDAPPAISADRADLSPAVTSEESHPLFNAPNGERLLFPGRSELAKIQTIADLAHQMQIPLYQLDLTNLETHQFPALIDYLVQHRPQLLLLQGCDRWFRRDCSLTIAQIQQFLKSRYCSGQLTVFSLEVAIGVPLIWRRSITGQLTLTPAQKRSHAAATQKSIKACD